MLRLMLRLKLTTLLFLVLLPLSLLRCSSSEVSFPRRPLLVVDGRWDLIPRPNLLVSTMLDLVSSLPFPSISRVASRGFVVHERLDGGGGDGEGGIGTEILLGVALSEPFDLGESGVEKRARSAKAKRRVRWRRRKRKQSSPTAFLDNGTTSLVHPSPDVPGGEDGHQAERGEGRDSALKSVQKRGEGDEERSSQRNCKDAVRDDLGLFIGLRVLQDDSEVDDDELRTVRADQNQEQRCETGRREDEPALAASKRTRSQRSTCSCRSKRRRWW